MTWASTQRVLLWNASIYAPSAPFATALLIEGDTIAWLGEDAAAHLHRDSADVVIDARGALVTPGFVDAHVHATSTGLTLSGLDLSKAQSLSDALDAIGRAASTLAPDDVLIGHGWDETTWPEHRPPTRAEVDAAAGNRQVYVSRIDVHSALVSSSLVAAVDNAPGADGYDAEAPVTREAHHRVRAHALGSVSAAQREQAQRAMREHAARLGIVSMHEMAGPAISSEADLGSLLALADAEPGPLITGYWGQLARDGGIEAARGVGAFGVGGDLFVDGALGSRTACLHEPYLDASGSGTEYLDVETIAAHIAAATEAHMQAGFHVIGDQACAAVTAALRQVSNSHGIDAIRAAGHRIEHAEMLSDDDIGALAMFGVTASMQPMFDALWGGPAGMYEQRLGAGRAHAMNRLSDLSAAGVLVAFGSDSPVTEMGPWAAMRAAMFHHQPEQRMTARGAFSAHTRAGWRAVGQASAGVIAPGAPAHLAIWDAPEQVVQTPDARIASWSTDPRSGTPGLPALAPDLPLPRALRTIVFGRTVYDSGEME